jgi:transposase
MKKVRKEGRPFVYEASFRRKVALEYLSGEFSQKELMRKYHLKGVGNIKRWLNEYKLQEQELLSLTMENPSEKSDQEPEKSAKDLAEELRLAKVKIAALETMIDLAEKQLNVDIRKKSGTKPS